MTWRELEAAAPELAGVGRRLLEEARLALLGTLRSDGSPRISPIEPSFAGGELVIGVMARSAKAHDLLRDPRCVVHSVVAEPDAGAPELKLYGRVGPAPAGADGWWAGRPAAEAHVYALRVEEAVLVEWDVAGGRMTVTTSSPPHGVRVAERPYP